MNRSFVVAALTASFALSAASDHAATTPAPTQYQCSVCHMKVSAAVAKADHYKDSMDGGKFIPVKPAKHVPAKAAKPMPKMSM